MRVRGEEIRLAGENLSSAGLPAEPHGLAPRDGLFPWGLGALFLSELPLALSKTQTKGKNLFFFSWEEAHLESLMSN